MKILFCQLRTFGDIIRTFPTLGMIKKAYPNFYIGYTCYPDMQEICCLCEDIDEVIVQPRLVATNKSEGGTRILDCRPLKEVTEKIRDSNFDVYVDFHGVFQSSLIGVLGNIPVRLGRDEYATKDGAYLFYNRLKEGLPLNKMERHFEMCRTLFPKIKFIADDNPDCRQKKIVSIFPGSSRIGILKRWPLENYNQLATYIGSGYKVKFIFGPEEQELSKILSANSNREIVSISTWNDAKKIIAESRVVVGNDSAYLHMAIWLGIPTVMITGATSYEINGVWKYGIGLNIAPKNSCERCDIWSMYCFKNHACMKSITTSNVYNNLQKYL